MIPLSEVQILNGPDDVLSFTPTSQITELEFRRGSLHVRHTKETAWPSVMIETAQQQATFWILAKIDGQWVAAGMERLRPNQQDKPEGDDPTGFITGFVEGRNFGAFNGHTFQRGDPMGFMVVQGNTRLAQDAPLRERSLVVEMAFPPSGTILWTEGQATPEISTTGGMGSIPPPPQPPAPSVDLTKVLEELEGIKRTLSNVATKDDIREAREEFVKSVKQLSAVLPFFKK
jgi:hypothetical protein